MDTGLKKNNAEISDFTEHSVDPLFSTILWAWTDSWHCLTVCKLVGLIWPDKVNLQVFSLLQFNSAEAKDQVFLVPGPLHPPFLSGAFILFGEIAPHKKET